MKKYNYNIEIFYDEEKEVYTATVPEIPSCKALSKTKEKAIEEINSFVDLWIEKALKEGEEIPFPKSEITSKNAEIIRHELRNIKCDKEKEQKLIQELSESNLRDRRHILNYIIEQPDKEIDLRTMLNELSELQNLLDYAVDFIFYPDENKKKDKSTSTNLRNFELIFEGISNGSTCINMTTPYDDKMLESDYDKTLNFVFESLDEMNEKNKDKLLNSINNRFKNGKSFLPKYANFYKSIGEKNNPVRLEWKNLDRIKHTVKIAPERARELKFLFRDKEKDEEKIIVRKGYIKILNLLNLSITFIEENEIRKEKPYKIAAIFDQLLYSKVINSPDKLLECSFKVTITSFEYTKLKKEKWELVNIKEIENTEIAEVLERRKAGLFDIYYERKDMPELNCVVSQEFAEKVKSYMEKRKVLMERLAT